MIFVLFLLHFCNFLPVSTLYLGNRLPEAYEFLGAKNLSIINAARSEAGLHADHDQEAEVRSVDPHVIIKTLPVGSGDATIIECPPPEHGEHHWFSLIDMGSTRITYGAMTRANYVAYIEGLFGNGYRLKHIFFTHPDTDHINYAYDTEGVGIYETEVGLLPMLIRDYPSYLQDITIHLSSQTYWAELTDIPGQPKPTLTKFIAYLIKVYDKFMWQEYLPNDVGNVIDICGTSNEDVKMKIIAANLGRTSNQMSLVMSLSYQRQLGYDGGRMLFLGDFDGSTQYLLLLRNEKYRSYLPADVVMVPHHGSDADGNGNPLFYDFVNAKHAIISSHINNMNNRHPKLTTLASICNGYYMTDEQPYYPYGLCNAMEKCPYIDMAQGYGPTFNLNNPIYIGKKEGCRTQIHQTTKKTVNVNEPLKAFIVTTNLYPNKDPVIVLQPWHV